jgi:O-antigen ligase/tetratricopeptide (TPR) repeat protein
MSSQSPSTSRLDPFIEVLLIALLAFLPAALGAVDSWTEAIATALGAAIALCLAIRAALARTSAVRPSLAWVAVALFVAIVLMQLLPLPAALIKTVSPHTTELRADLLGDLPDANRLLKFQTLSLYPRATRQDLRVVLLAVTVFAAVVMVYRDARRIQRLLVTIALIGGACAALAAAQDLTHARAIYWRIPISAPAYSGPFINHSHFGQFMNLCIGAALALLLSRLPGTGWLPLRTRIARIAWLAVIIVAGLVTVTLSLTRGGMVSIVVSGAFTVIVLLISRNLRRMAGVLLLLGVLAIGLLYYSGFERLSARMAEPGAIGVRLQMLHDIRDLVRTFPLLGTGLGSFEWIYPMYDRTLSPSTATHLENEYLQAVIETGAIGLLAVMTFVAIIIARYVRALRQSDARIAVAAAGLGYGLLAVMVHSLTDFGQHLPAIACLSAATCGLLMNLGASERDRAIPVARPVRVMALIAVTGICAFMIVDAHVAWHGEQHWRAAQPLAWDLGDQDWKAPDAELQNLFKLTDLAIAADPDNARYRYWAAVYRWSWLSTKRDAESGLVATTPENVAAAQRIIGELNLAREKCPTYGLVYSLLGQIEYKYLDRPIGVNHIQAGYRLSRNDATAAFAAGQMDAKAGKFESAEQKFHESIKLDWTTIGDIIDVYLHQVDRPELAIRGIGDHYNGLIQLRNALRENPKWEKLATAAEEHAFDILEAQANAPGASAWTSAMVGGYRLDHGRLEVAEPLLARAVELEPSNLLWRLQLVDVLTKLGKIPQATEQAREAVRLHPESAEARQALERLTAQLPR